MQIDGKTSKLYLKFFYEMENNCPNLYKTKFKLLKNIKLETAQAISLGSKLLKNERAMENYTTLIKNYF